MKIRFSFHITAEVSDYALEIRQPEEAIAESVREFGQDLQKFLEKHPFVVAVSMTKQES